MKQKTELESSKIEMENRILQNRIRKIEAEIAAVKQKSESVTGAHTSLIALLESVGNIVYRLDDKGRIVYINNSISRYGYAAADLIGVSVFDLIHPDDRSEAQNRLNERRTGHRRTQGLKLRIIPKKYLGKKEIPNAPILLFHAEGIYRKNEIRENVFDGTQGVAYDISEMARVEKGLKETADQLHAVLDSVPGSVSWMTKDLIYLGVNRFLAAQLGKPADYFVGKKAGFLSHTPEFISMAGDFFSSSEQRMENEVTLDQSNMIRHFLIVGQKYMENQAAVFVGIDTTRLKQAEKEARIALKRQMELLKEIHHRVKNNMQIMICFLDMHIDNLSKEDKSGMLMHFLSRIRSMATIHELVCRRPDYSMVDLSGFFRSLVHFFIARDLLDTNRIKYKIPASTCFVSAEQAVPLGVLTNELIFNIILHAFPDGRTGRFAIELNQLQDDKMELIISDNGIGIPRKINTNEPESLGLQLTRSLADQLDGKLTLDTMNGTTWRLEFKRAGITNGEQRLRCRRTHNAKSENIYC